MGSQMPNINTLLKDSRLQQLETLLRSLESLLIEGKTRLSSLSNQELCLQALNSKIEELLVKLRESEHGQYLEEEATSQGSDRAVRSFFTNPQVQVGLVLLGKQL